MPQLEALCSYWRGTPPVHVSVARYLGHRPQADAPRALPSFEEATSALGMGGGRKFVPPARMLQPVDVQAPGQETPS